jgi:hypothetical protein
VDSTGSIQRNLRTISTQITTLAEFLYDQIDLKEFQLLRLIPTDILTENGCVIMADAGLNAWPLICDATWYSIEWIRLFLTNKQLIIVRYHVRLISFVFEFLENEFIVAITYSIRNSIIRRIASVINRL